MVLHLVTCHDPFVTMPYCLRVRAWHPLYLLRGLHLTSSLLLSLVFYVNIRVGSVIRLFLSRRRDSFYNHFMIWIKLCKNGSCGEGLFKSFKGRERLGGEGEFSFSGFLCCKCCKWCDD